MPIDLTTLRPGDTVKFRCGASAVVDSITWITGSDWRIIFVSQKEGENEWYDNQYYSHLDGRLRNLGISLLDIIEIVPKPQPRRGEKWINISPCGDSTTWDTKELAEKHKDADRIACVLATWMEGQFDGR